MNKRFVVIICAAALALSSCIDVTQYVGAEQGKLVVDTRFTVQKAMFALAQSMGGSKDAPEISDSDVERIRDSLPSDMILAVEKIDTELEAGVSLRVRYASNNVPNLAASAVPIFFPYRKGRSLIVDIANPDTSGSTERSDSASAILAGFKYRLFIARSALAAPTIAVLVSDTSTVPATLIVYPEFAVAEVSMGTLLSAKGPLKLVVE